MPNNSQSELFGVDPYGVHKCAKCGALGTIVAMKKCCIIAALVAAEAKPTPTEKSENGKSAP